MTTAAPAARLRVVDATRRPERALKVDLPFADRVEAGRLLGAELASRRLSLNRVVLALPRGGVPVGFEVAKALYCPFDVVIVRKLGVPWQKELAMGAIAGDGARILDHDLIRTMEIPQDAIDAVLERERKELARRERLYHGGSAPAAIKAEALRGMDVVLVDDGIATGSTMIAAARHVTSQRPRRLIIAAPVAAYDSGQRLLAEADECVFLALPSPFYAVGEWYRDFRQIEDEEVLEILAVAAKTLPTTPSGT